LEPVCGNDVLPVGTSQLTVGNHQRASLLSRLALPSWLGGLTKTLNAILR